MTKSILLPCKFSHIFGSIHWPNWPNIKTTLESEHYTLPSCWQTVEDLEHILVLCASHRAARARVPRCGLNISPTVLTFSVLFSTIPPPWAPTWCSSWWTPWSSPWSSHSDSSTGRRQSTLYSISPEHSVIPSTAADSNYSDLSKYCISIYGAKAVSWC